MEIRNIIEKVQREGRKRQVGMLYGWRQVALTEETIRHSILWTEAKVAAPRCLQAANSYTLRQIRRGEYHCDA